MNRERLAQRFMRYVRCASESGSEGAFCKLLEDELLDMGLEVRRDEAGAKCGSDGWNVYAKLKGEGNPILFSAHTDTVYPGKNIVPVIEDGVIRSSGGTILGADDKAGIAAVVEAVESVMESGGKHRTVEMLFSLSEEIGMLGAKYADYKNIESREAVVLDSDRIGEIINRNPANVVLRFEIIGKPSHAGLAPEDGIHALKAAAKAVNDIPVGNVDDISVMNVSNFISEGKTNVVAAKACFDMEIRSFEEERLQEHIAASEKAVKDACGLYAAQYTMALDRHSDVLYVPEESPLVKGLVKAFESLGIQSRVTRSFGGCDATYLFANGLAVVNIGIGMQAVHSAAENIALKDLETTAEVIRKLIVTNE